MVVVLVVVAVVAVLMMVVVMERRRFIKWYTGDQHQMNDGFQIINSFS